MKLASRAAMLAATLAACRLPDDRTRTMPRQPKAAEAAAIAPILTDARRQATSTAMRGRWRRGSTTSRSTSASISTPSASAAPPRSTSSASPTPRRSSSTTRASRSTASPTVGQAAAVARSARSTRISARRWPSRFGPTPSGIVIHYKSAPDARRAAVADARADRGQEAPLSVQPGRGDREPQLDPDPGFARHPPDLGSEDPRPQPLTAVMSAPRAAEPRRHRATSAASPSSMDHSRSRPT